MRTSRRLSIASLACVLGAAFFAAPAAQATPPLGCDPLPTPGANDWLPCQNATQGYHVFRSSGVNRAFADGGFVIASSALPSSSAVGVALTQGGQGAWVLTKAGTVAAYGSATALTPSQAIANPAGIADWHSNGGYWITDSAGHVTAVGSATDYGSVTWALNAPIVGIVAANGGTGYWLVASDGGVFGFGSAHFYGSMGKFRLNAPVVALDAYPDGTGYWLVAADGGIFGFGSSRYFGGAAHWTLQKPITSMVSTDDNNGYWLLGADGGVFAFGSAVFSGSDAGGSGGAAIAITR